MCRSDKIKRHSRQGISAWSVGILAFLFITLVPAQAFAQAVCNSNLNWYLSGPSGGHWFVDDELTVNATLSALNIGGAGTQYLQIPSFGFAGDCTTLSGLNWGNCIEANSVAIEYLGDPTSQNCKDDTGQDIIFQLPESNTITFTPIKPIHLAENTSCDVAWNFKVAKFNTDAKQATLNQVSAFAAGASPAACVIPDPDSDGWLQIGTTSAGNNGGVIIDTCGIKVKKEICDSTTDCSNDANWKNAAGQDNRLVLAANGEALYRATITNTGSVAYVGDITVNDEALGINTTVGSLAAGASTTIGIGGLQASDDWKYRCQSTTNFKNQINVEASCRGGEIPVMADDKNNAWAGCDNYVEDDPSIAIEKSTNGQDADDAPGPYITVGGAVNWTYTVTNTGNVELTNVGVTDNQGVVVTCPKSTLAVDESMECTGAAGVAVAGQYSNIGEASGTPPEGDPVTNTDPSHYFGVDASITIEKSTNGEDADTAPGPYIEVGEAVNWTYVVTNTSNVELTNVGVTDNQGVVVTCPKSTLAVDESMECTGEAGVAEAGQYSNIGEASGTPPAGDPVTNTDPSHYFGVDASITIEKSTNGEDADSAPGPNIPAGDAVNWLYVVTNTSNVELTDVGVTDNQGVVVTCPKSTLAVDESMDCTGAAGVAVAGQYSNIGEASGTPPVGDPVTNTDPSHYFGTGEASILMLKEISVDGGETWFDANTVGSAAIAVFPSDALYRFKVTNNGTAPLKDVVVNDSELGITGDDEYEIGDMAVGAMVLITVDQEPLLYYPDRCEGRGTYTNTATASGASDEDDTPVSDDDAAVLKCIGEPHITILKEISPTGSAPWYDDQTLPQEYPSDAWYRITVTNDGTTPLTDVKVLDGDLLIDETIGSLAVNQQVVLTSAKVSELYQKDRCTGSGTVGNLASASGKSLDDPSDTVDDSDTATLVCVGSPMIQVIKEISLDNSTWYDADTEGNALVTQAPSDAWYRITVKNTGPVDLTNVVLNDGTLGIFNYDVGDIAVGQQVVLTSGQIGDLYYPNRCTGTGTFGNTATAEGESSETGSTSSDSDEAWLECTGTPDIRIVKEISTNGGVTWYDGSTPSTLPPVDAWYRLTVTNTGDTDLENVVVNDGVLGIVNYSIGNLVVNQTVVLTQAQIGALYQENRCTSAGSYVNTASASGDSQEFPYGSVNDSDSATLVCGEKFDICDDGGGRPKDLYLQYNGTYESDNDQGRVGNPDGSGPLPVAPVTVRLYDKNQLEATLYPVNVGDELTVLGSWTNSGKIPPDIGVEVMNGNQVLQRIRFHGSCSAPLNIGDKFGAVTITGYEP